MNQWFLSRLKSAPISFRPNNPHQTAKNHISYARIKFPQPRAPTEHQTLHRNWHNPLEPEDLKHMHPQRVSYRTMDEEMIHRFLIAATHTTPIHQRETPKHEIKDPTMNCCPQKESHPFRNLNFPNTLRYINISYYLSKKNFPNTLPRKTGSRSTLNLIVIGLNIKLTILIKSPVGTVTQHP